MSTRVEMLNDAIAILTALRDNGLDDANLPPEIDGCRIVHRGDGFDVCKVHFRHWKAGSQMCPGKHPPVFLDGEPR